MTKNIKILTTDSGLGGLSITAELVERIKSEGQFEQAEIIFFNCRPSHESGYDPMDSNEIRAKVFSQALYAMYEKFQPDVIMIACNTLSAIYEMCEFSKSPPVQVVGIIEDGVEKNLNLLRTRPEMEMIMFGTPTTVSSGVHKNILSKNGIDSSRLHYQDCLSLPNAIDRGPKSEEVKEMIEKFMKSASIKTQGKAFGISLLCTHFGYSLPIFLEFAQKIESFSGHIINPNSAIVDSFLRKYVSGSSANAEITVKCYTHSVISPAMRTTMFPLLAEISPHTAQALLDMIDTPNMFKIE